MVDKKYNQMVFCYWEVRTNPDLYVASLFVASSALITAMTFFNISKYFRARK